MPIISPIHEHNDCHVPAGSPAGGQFCAKGAGGAASWPLGDNVPRKLGLNYPRAVSQHYASWRKSLSPDEAYAIREFTASSDAVNQPLYQGLALPPQAQLIQQALRRAPSPPPPELVWRSVRGQTAAQVQQLTIGGTVRLAGFQSTSINPLEARGDTLLEIAPRAGADISQVSGHTYEFEFLLPHGRQYRLVGRKPVVLDNRTVTVFQLAMVD